jgi:hypothetical protein
MKTKYLYLFFLVPFLIFTACNDDNDSGPDYDTDPGTFTISITGGITRDISGAAIFTNITNPETGQRVFYMSMAGDDSQVYFAKRGIGLLQEATL